MTEMENIMVNVVITQTYVIKCVRLPPPHLQIMIWNLDCPEQLIKNPVKTISHHTDVVLSMSFNTDCSLLATTCKDRKIRLMEPRSGNLLRVTLTVFASLRKTHPVLCTPVRGMEQVLYVHCSFLCYM